MDKRKIYLLLIPYLGFFIIIFWAMFSYHITFKRFEAWVFILITVFTPFALVSMLLQAIDTNFELNIVVYYGIGYILLFFIGLLIIVVERYIIENT